MRYERKYSLVDLPLDFVRQSILLHPAGFHTLFPERQINNIYLDTPSLHTYRDNIMGISQRKKFRLRWYGTNTQQLQQPTFEIKIKENQLGRKESLPTEGLTWDQLPQFWANFAPIWQTGIQPVLVNTYQRAYFGSLSGQFRITLDWDLKFGDYRPDAFQAPYTQASLAVLELKYAPEAEAELDQITQYFPFRPTKSSKYVTGIKLIYG